MGWLNRLLYGTSDSKTLPIENPNIPLHITAGNYLYNITEELFKQVGTIPQVLKDLWVQPAAKNITLGITSAIWDITPVIALNVANNFIQSYQEGYDDNATILSVDGVLLTSLTLLNTCITVYTFQQISRALIKATIVSSCAPSALKLTTNIYKKNLSICKPECNGALVLLNGYTNETASYYANQFAISATRKMPYLGEPLAEIVSLYATGRYIAGLTTTRCREHEFLKSEATLSLGITYKMLSLMLNKILQGTVPPICMAILDDIPLILTIAIAHHQQPPLVTAENRTLVDPLEIYENITSMVFESSCIGGKAFIQKFLARPGKPIIPWQTLADHSLMVLKHPLTQKTMPLVLPPMLHNWDNFINDPVISPRWNKLQKQLISIITSLEAGSKSNLVTTANKAPKQAARLFQFLFGFPKPIVKVLLGIMGNDGYMKVLSTLKAWLQIHGVEKINGLSLQPNAIPLRILPVSAIITEPEHPPILELPKHNDVNNHKFFPSANKVPLGTHNVNKFIGGGVNMATI